MCELPQGKSHANSPTKKIKINRTKCKKNLALFRTLCELKHMTNSSSSTIATAINLSIRTNNLVRINSSESIATILAGLSDHDVTHSIETDDSHDLHGIDLAGNEYRINVTLLAQTKNYWVKNKTATNPTSPEMTVGTLLVENVSNEVYAVIEAEKIWKTCGYLFHPEMSVAKETQDCLPIF